MPRDSGIGGGGAEEVYDLTAFSNPNAIHEADDVPVVQKKKLLARSLGVGRGSSARAAKRARTEDAASAMEADEVIDVEIIQPDGVALPEIGHEHIEVLEESLTLAELKEKDSGTPDLRSTLMTHQQYGLAWLHKREEITPFGGILADEMGLGKTVQMIALSLRNRPPTLVPGTHAPMRCLVVVPASLVHQWKSEILFHTDANLEVYVHHDAGRSTDPHYLAHKDFVITTYNTLAAEARPYTEWQTANAKGRHTPRPKEKLAAVFRVHWHRVILDEASYIKNSSTGFAKAACMVRATHRWCITGTPIQNSLEDLFSLLQFLQCEPYNKKEVFRRAFVPTTEKSKLRRLQEVLKSLCLRRTKQSKVEGKKVLELPDRELELRHDEFGAEEQDYYRSIEKASQLKFGMFVKRGTVRKNYANALLLLLRLRQCCDHPMLTQTAESPEAAAAAEEEESVEVDGTGALLNEDGSLPEVALGRKAKAKAKAAVKKLASAMSAEAQRIPQAIRERIHAEGTNDECPICLDIISRQSAAVTLCGHAFCKDCITAHVNDKQAASAQPDCPMCRSNIAAADLVDAVHVIPAPGALDSVSDGSDSEGEEGGAAAAKVRTVKQQIADLEHQARSSIAHFRGEPLSTKISKLLAILDLEIQENPRVKCLVFSQWTSMLDLVEPALSKKMITYKRYDGSLTASEREDVVQAFMHDREVNVMTCSLKACSYGLNLTAATRVFLLDPWWNPAVEEQAIGRAHRIGQCETVKVYRMFIHNSVEQRILKLQEEKADLAASAMGDGGGASGKMKLSERDLMRLFNVDSRGNAIDG